jgi:hypothetical protein
MNEKRRLSPQDQDVNEDTETISGAVGGATGIGVGAGLGLMTLGPLGGVLGALAGAAGGWWAGQEVQKAVEDVDRSDNRFRRAHEHAGADRPYEELRHGYQLGYIAGRNPEYAASAFREVEAEIRDAWVQAHVRDENPIPWEDVRESARAGYRLSQVD